jgi:hypothetical protein
MVQYLVGFATVPAGSSGLATVKELFALYVEGGKFQPNKYQAA